MGRARDQEHREATGQWGEGMTVFVPVFLLTFLAVLVLAICVLGCTIAGHRATAKRFLLGLISLLAVYGALLVGAGLFSKQTRLKLGEEKCFDDWCFEVKGFHRSGDDYVLSAGALNSGMRTQAPDSPQLFAVFDGRAVPIPCPRLGESVGGHSENDFSVSFHAPHDAHTIELRVTEGGGPSAVIIDDENSPFHAKSAWSLSP
jgi:hypothetical protein